jgi:hypothetical protein
MWWAPIGAAALYVLSLFPALILTAWLIEGGIVTQGRANSVLTVVYAPVLWVSDHFPAFQNGLDRIGEKGNPLLPKRFHR